MLRPPVESSQYTSIRYTDRLVEAGLQASIGTIGDSYDNALAETVNGLYKAELVFWEGPWKGADDLELATLGVTGQLVAGCDGPIPTRISLRST